MLLSLQNSSGKFEEGSEESSSVHEISTAQVDNNPHALVLSTFETIWNAVNQFRWVYLHHLSVYYVELTDETDTPRAKCATLPQAFVFVTRKKADELFDQRRIL